MTGLEALKNKRFEHLKEKFKSFPVEDMPRKSYTDKTSNGLAQCIIDWFTFHDLYAVRIQTQGQYRDGIGWTKGTTAKGTADLHCIMPGGKHLSCEIKIGKDRLSPEQIETQKKVEACNGLFFVAKDFESFYQWFNNITNGRP